MSSPLARASRGAAAVLMAVLSFTTACATATGMRRGHQAELAQDYDRAVVEYTKLARANPANLDARSALERVKLRAAHA